MKTSDQINEIASALAKAQSDIRPAIKESTNPHYKQKFSSLTSMWDSIRGPLTANGLSILQDAQSTSDGVSVTTRLVHSSGQWLESGPLTIPILKRDAQAVGSAITYGKRYSLAALVGVVSDEDDDGNKACEPPRQSVITTAQAGQIRYMLGEIDDPNLMMHILTSCNVRAIEQVPAERFTKLMSWLEGKRTPKLPAPVALITPQEIVESSGDEMTAEERAGVFL